MTSSARCFASAFPTGRGPAPPASSPSSPTWRFEGKALTIAGDGSQCRSFIYVEDLADGIVAGARARAAANRTYNLSGEEVVTILEIAETVQEMTGGCEIVHTPPRPGDFPGKEISNARALEELGWKAETSFREGCASTSSGCVAAPARPTRSRAKSPR